MQYSLAKDSKNLFGSIRLPASKSISNRLLILYALARKGGSLGNLSDSDDTTVLKKALESGQGTIDIGHAGTAMRFLTAYLCIQEGRYILTGSGRMLQRPIGELADALRGLGARIEYMGIPGFPPLSIEGTRIAGGELSADGSISSQFISALMMIGPALEMGLVIRLENEVVSSSYIHLTKNLMTELGIPVKFAGTRIEVPHQQYDGKDMQVEGDWSAAGYWYAMAALSEQADFEILGLRKESYQGDSVLPELFRPLGVDTGYQKNGIVLKRIQGSLRKFEFDFSDNPDLVQTMAVLCCLMDLPFMMRGTRTLKIKETDRIFALEQEMKKLGFLINADPLGTWISWNGEKSPEVPRIKTIKTYQDHRMALAFSPAALRFPGLVIEDPGVVNKSYPGFWEDLGSTGFSIEEMD